MEGSRDESADQAAVEHKALQAFLTSTAFLEASSGENLRRKNGARVPWIFYGPAASLTHEGSTLIAEAFLVRLQSFKSTQLATYGTSAISILASLVALGKGRYTGLTIRREAKAYGACRRIDGPTDLSRPVVVIDESISSGCSLQAAISALESEGFSVEGAICLVEFSGYESVRWLSSRGYRIETIFDVWRDLNRSSGTQGPLASEIEPCWHGTRLPAGLSPAQVARAVAEQYLKSRSVPLPPLALDRPYDSSGGTYLSIRRLTDDTRLIREGFRRDEGDEADVGHDVVLATWKALSSPWLENPLNLDTVKFSVSLLGAPECIGPQSVDPQHYALLMKGQAPLSLLGFALPNAPHYDDENEQYHYARTISTNFWQSEPEALFRQPVARSVEPGYSWPASGAPLAEEHWSSSKSLADIMAARATHVLRHLLRGEPLSPAPPFPVLCEPIHGLGVSLYLHGLAGCSLSYKADLDEALRQATTAALGDKRFGAKDVSTHAAEEFTLVVSLLYQRQRLGYVAKERLKLFFRIGKHTLMASGEGKSGLILAHFAATHSLDPETYAAQVLQKAGLDAKQAYWTSFETVSWLIGNGNARRLVRGIPERVKTRQEGHEDYSSMAKLLAGFVFAQQGEDGLPAYFLKTLTGTRYAKGTATRVLLAVTGLLRAGKLLDAESMERIGAMMATFLQADEPGSPSENLTWDSGSDAQLLLNISLLDNRADYRRQALRLVERLRPMFRADGVIYATTAPSRMAADLDFLSGSALLALATAAQWLPHVLEGLDLEQTLRWYRRRFSLVHPWGMVWWHGQCWTALAKQVPGAREFVFEIVDWALQWQSRKSSSFIINLEPHQNSFLSACVLEAVADAWKLALDNQDLVRAEAYRSSWVGGLTFLEKLVVREGDDFFSLARGAAVGGVRATLHSSDIRIDYVGHTLIALAKGIALFDQDFCSPVGQGNGVSALPFLPTTV